jgi:large subunit ribosomal protein L13
MNKEKRLYYKNEQMARMVNKESVIDATGCVAGRLGTVVAKRLLMGETIHIVNAEKALITGSQETIKARYTFKKEVGTRRKGPFLPRLPHMLLKRTVRGMLPYQLPNGRAALKRLMCHIGVPPELKGKTPEVIKVAQKETPLSMTMGEISRYLGGSFTEMKA